MEHITKFFILLYFVYCLSYLKIFYLTVFFLIPIYHLLLCLCFFPLKSQPSCLTMLRFCLTGKPFEFSGYLKFFFDSPFIVEKIPK